MEGEEWHLGWPEFAIGDAKPRRAPWRLPWRGRLTYQVRSAGRGAALDERLFPVASFNRVPLPFTEAVAALIHKGRGRWEGQSLWDGRVRATGVSHQDVIRATIEAVWH